MLHPYHSATFFLYVRPTLHCLIPPPKTNLPLPIEGSHPHTIKSHPPAPWPTIPNDIIGIHTLNYCNYFCRINWSDWCMVSLVLGHFSPLTHRSLTLTFTPNLLTLLTQLQLLASILHTSCAQRLKWPRTEMSRTEVSKYSWTYCILLHYSITLLNVTVIHSCPFCALNFTFACISCWIQKSNIIFQTPAINVQAKIFDNNFHLYIKSQIVQCFDAVGWVAGRASGQ